MLNFQEQFFNSFLHSQDIETNWIRFKQAISDVADETIPKKLTNLKIAYPNAIMQKMKERKRLYNRAKLLQTDNA